MLLFEFVPRSQNTHRRLRPANSVEVRGVAVIVARAGDCGRRERIEIQRTFAPADVDSDTRGVEREVRAETRVAPRLNGCTKRKLGAATRAIMLGRVTASAIAAASAASFLFRFTYGFT